MAVIKPRMTLKQKAKKTSQPTEKAAPQYYNSLES